MKGNLLILLVIMALGIISCGKDKDDSCSQSDWIGNWEATTSSCYLKKGMVVTITKGSKRNSIRFNNNDETVFNNCGFTLKNNGFTVAGTLEDDIFTISITDDEGTCTNRLKKK